MKALTVTIVVFAGAVLAAAGVLAKAIGRVNNHPPMDEAGWAWTGGWVMIALGLFWCVCELLSKDHPEHRKS